MTKRAVILLTALLAVLATSYVPKVKQASALGSGTGYMKQAGAMTAAADGEAAPTGTSSLCSTPKPAADSEPAPASTPFTIAWFPDTQASAYHEPKALTAMGKWVADHRDSDDIVYVLHTGDLVDNGFKEWQWKNFELAYDQFDGEVPFFPIAGNHDLGVKLRNWDGYLARPYVKDAVPYEQQFAGGKATYMTFNAGGTDFLVVGVGHSAEKESAEWVRDVFAKFPDHYGILMMHGYIHPPDNELYENGPFMYENVVSKCPNLYMTLSGHFRGSAYRLYSFDDDGDGAATREVHTIMCNYQGYEYNGGQIRLLIFDPADRSLTVDTFSTLTGHPMRDETMKKPIYRLENVF
ncbi:MAG: metallophosphoesterase [Clostridia bacterium]